MRVAAPSLSATLRRLAAGLMLGAALIPAGVAGLSAASNPPPPNVDQIRDLFAEGVKNYRVGRYTAAANSFRAAIKLNPENKQVYEFYLAVGEVVLMTMVDKGVEEDILKDIRRRALIYQTELRHDERYINLMIGKLAASEEERVVAQRELIAVGPLAVPHLVAKISDNRNDELRVACRITLTQMGHRAVVPMVEALNSADQRLLTTLAATLADIGDTRALPRLKLLSEDSKAEATTREVAQNAVTAIAQRARITQLPATDRLYFGEALRYFRGNDQVRDEVVQNESLMWRWNQDAGSDASKQLTYVRVPRYAWNELMAEELVLDGARAFPEFTHFHPLLIAILAAQDVEATARLDIAKMSTVPPQMADDFADAISTRIQALSEQKWRVVMAGPVHLYRALGECVRSQRTDVAAYLLKLLEDPLLARANEHLPEPVRLIPPPATAPLVDGKPPAPIKVGGLSPDKAASDLVAALDHEDKRVRYGAAITLVSVDPMVAYFNSEKVIPILSDAIGETAAQVVLVIDQDYRGRNAARASLESKGFLATAVANGHDALVRLAETPIVDAIVITADLMPTLRGPHGETIDVPEQRAHTLVDALRKDWRTEKTPILISLPENPEMALKLKALFEGKDVAFVTKPFNAVELATQIELKMKAADPPQINRKAAELIALRAAQAIAKADPQRTQLDLSLALDALVKTLDIRPDDLRIAACQAIARISQHAKGAASAKAMVGRVLAVYNARDGEHSPAVRAALLLAIGAMDPNDPAAIEAIAKAMKHDALPVREAAFAAVGHGMTIESQQLLKYHLHTRVDARAPGAAPVTNRP